MKKSVSTFIIIAMIAGLLFSLSSCGAGTPSDEALSPLAAEAILADNESGYDGPGYLQVDAEKAKELMDTEEDCIILDVRTEEEYAEGHIPDAVLIPDYEIRDRAEEELPDKDVLILVYCRSGNRSKTASAALVELGYTNVVEFGGIRSWPYDIVK